MESTLALFDKKSTSYQDIKSHLETQAIALIPSKEQENIEYSRSLFMPHENINLEKWNYEDVQKFLQVNPMRIDDDSISKLDFGVVIEIDKRTDENYFVIGQEFLDREHLYEKFPLVEFGIAPEDLFSQQYIDVYRWHISDNTTLIDMAITRSVEDAPMDFNFGRKTSSGFSVQKTVKTKIYIAKEKFHRIIGVKDMFESFKDITETQIKRGTYGRSFNFVNMLKDNEDVLNRIEAAEKRMLGYIERLAISTDMSTDVHTDTSVHRIFH